MHTNTHTPVSYTHLDVYKRQNIRLEDAICVLISANIRVNGDYSGREKNYKMIKRDMCDDFSLILQHGYIRNTIHRLLLNDDEIQTKLLYNIVYITVYR